MNTHVQSLSDCTADKVLALHGLTVFESPYSIRFPSTSRSDSLALPGMAKKTKTKTQTLVSLEKAFIPWSCQLES